MLDRRKSTDVKENVQMTVKNVKLTYKALFLFSSSSIFGRKYLSQVDKLGISSRSIGRVAYFISSK